LYTIINMKSIRSVIVVQCKVVENPSASYRHPSVNSDCKWCEGYMGWWNYRAAATYVCLYHYHYHYH